MWTSAVMGWHPPQIQHKCPSLLWSVLAFGSYGTATTANCSCWERSFPHTSIPSQQAQASKWRQLRWFLFTLSFSSFILTPPFCSTPPPFPPPSTRWNRGRAPPSSVDLFSASKQTPFAYFRSGYNSLAASLRLCHLAYRWTYPLNLQRRRPPQ